MSALGQALLPRPAAMPSVGWWLLLLSLLAFGLFINWIAAFVLLALAIVQRARPFDFLTSYLMAVVVGSFINYSNGQVTYQMWILSAFIVFMLYCYVLLRRWDALVIPNTPATTPLLLFFALTWINYARGLVVGNSTRYATLELLAVLVLTSSLLMANRRLNERELRATMFVIWVMGLGHFMLGAYIYTIIHFRAVGVWFTPVTGLVAMMMLNFALREPKRSGRLMWVVGMAPILAHQFLSFTRGFWLSLIVGGLFSLFAYVGRGEGVMLRARRAAVVVATMCVLMVVGVVLANAVLGIGDLWKLAGERFTSSASTRYSRESASNVIRLIESIHVIEDIQKQPILGHGLGYSFVFREPITFTLDDQWYVHQNYLLVWLKQGLIGLVLWVWLLIGFVRTGLQGSRLPNRVEQSWCTGVAAVVVYCMVYSLVHFPFAETNTTFTFALLTGVAMRLTASNTIALRWKGRRMLPEGS